MSLFLNEITVTKMFLSFLNLIKLFKPDFINQTELNARAFIFF